MEDIIRDMSVGAQNFTEFGQDDRPYHFRKLDAGDIWPMVSILSKMGIREIGQLASVQQILFPTAAQQDGTGSTGSAVPAGSISGKSGVDAMFDIIGLVLEKLPDCRNDIYALLARVTGMKESEIDSLDFGVFVEMIIDFYRKDELQNFMKAVSKLLK